LESHSEGFPLTFLDHRLILGDSITGPFFEEMLTYPGSKRPMDDLLTQGLRENFSAALNDAILLIQSIESTLCSTMPDFEIKAKRREELEARLAPFKAVAAAWAGGVMLSKGCDDDAYADLVLRVAEDGNLPERIESERLLQMLSAGLFVSDVPQLSTELVHLLKSGRNVAALPFDLAFPEVFFRTSNIATRSGFDLVLGNPPWDAIRPKAKEFFASFDFEILAAPTKRERTAIEKRLKSDRRIATAYQDYQDGFDRQHRIHDVLFTHQVAVIEGLKTGGDPDAAKLFLERNQQLLAIEGQTGLVVPSGFHANEGATALRALYLERMALRCCFSFENRRQLFEIHRSFKFAVLIAIRGSSTTSFPCAFYLYDDAWLFSESRNPEPLTYSLDFIKRTGGEYLTLMELRSKRDFELAAVLFSNRDKFGQACRQQNIVLGRELHMTDDAWRFVPTNQVFGESDPRRLAPEIAMDGWLVLDEGKNFWQFEDCWGEPPRYLVPVEKLRDKPLYLTRASYFRLAYRSVASSTNERTSIFALLPPGVTCGHSVGTEQEPEGRRLGVSLAIAAIGNTFTFDWCVRQIVSANVTQYQLFAAPVPQFMPFLSFLAHQALRLTCNHSGYNALWNEQLADNWHETNREFSLPVLRSNDERWEVRATIDAIIADAYGLDRFQYKYILDSFNHKSFRQAPDLCLAKFDTLKEIGIDKYIRKYDPYSDIPLKNSVPQPVIIIPIPAIVEDSQHTLDFSEQPTRRARRTIATHIGGEDALYQKLRELLSQNHQITSAGAQSALGCAAAEARALLKRLVEENFAAVDGRGRSTRYILVSSEEDMDAHPAGRSD
jgi:hypothetical protein